jgi:hypothetical protein
MYKYDTGLPAMKEGGARISTPAPLSSVLDNPLGRLAAVLIDQRNEVSAGLQA